MHKLQLRVGDTVRTIKNIIGSEKGSMLLYSVIMVFVLTMLSISIIGFSMSNFKMGRIASDKNKAFYMADGAVEEALWELYSEAAAARDEAQEWINDGYRKTDEWQSFVEALYETEDVTPDYIKDEIKKKLEEEFEKKYFESITANGNGLSKSIIQKLESPEQMMGYEKANLAKIKDVVVESELIETKSGKYIDVTLTSAASFNKINKKAQLRLKLLNPQLVESQDGQKTFEEKKIMTNDIYMRALTCEGDIIASGGTVTVKGDAYAFGTYPHKSRTANSEMGGIVSGYSPLNDDFIDQNEYFDNVDKGKLKDEISGKGSLVIGGSASTKTNLQTRKIGSVLSISDNAYCNSVITLKEGSDSKIAIKGNSYMYDDMELNADGSEIVVGDGEENGEIWALLDGDPAGNYGDRSGSIIVNSEDLEGSINANRIYLAGTAYINARDEENKLYQTGESVSFSRYSYFYQNEYEGQSDAQYKTYKDDQGSEYSFLEGDKIFKINHFLNYASKNFSDILKTDKSKVKVAGIEKKGDLNYFQGAVIANSKIYGPKISDDTSLANIEEVLMDPGTFEDEKGRIIEELNRRTSLFGARDYSDNENIKGIFENLIDKDTNINEIRDNNICIVTSRDVYINNDNEFGSDSSIHVEGSNLRGLVFTKGNVFISGDFNFEGAIVAKGNIVFWGDGEKNIKFNLHKILQTIAENEMLFDFFDSANGKTVIIENNDYSNIAELKVNTKNEGQNKLYVIVKNIKARNGFDDVMEFKSWKEVD